MLPVAEISDELISSLMEGDCILQAPPGAGKSTWLPLQLLQASQFTQQKIIMLQPRRVAVRSVARYLASQLGEEVGKTVGYRIRGESRISAQTRLEVVTEGLLTRKLQQDPELNGYGLIIFDEFHERNLHGDFSLALACEIQQALREDLRLLVMSATLDAEPVVGLLPNARVLRSEGRSFPVDVRYLPVNRNQLMSSVLYTTVLKALKEEQGDVLVFVAGRKEIEQLIQRLETQIEPMVQLRPLYGELDRKQQDQALQPATDGQRKVVIGTNIAETSLTIPGIRVVIDSGLENRARYNLKNGITTIAQQPISQASAIQRSGRAGRLGPGVCYRMWARENQDRMRKHSVPEILETDISALILEAKNWGSEVEELALLDHPAPAQLQQGTTLLKELEALDQNAVVTAHGRAVCEFGTHPGIANMLLRAREMGNKVLSLACAIGALLESQRRSNDGVDLDTALHQLRYQKHHPVWQQVNHWHRRVKVSLASDWPTQLTGVLVGFACPDRIGKATSHGRFVLTNGSGAKLDSQEPLSEADYLVAGQLLGLADQADARITLAARMTQGQLDKYFSHLYNRQQQCVWKDERIQASESLGLGKIVLKRERLPMPDAEHRLAMWQDVIHKRGIGKLPLSDKARLWLEKCRLLQGLGLMTDCPDFSDQALLESWHHWLWPYMQEITQWQQLKPLDWFGMLRDRMDWQQQQRLEKLLPEKIVVPTGSACRLEYHPDGVKLSVRMQELYGLTATPHVAEGKIPVTIEILSPARRPIQTTQDLAGFWSGSYREVQKEMKGRYPRHFWPDDPANAQATTKTKKKM